jgi:peptidoglycan/LPS O-acetylase OafA/YrhL
VITDTVVVTPQNTAAAKERNHTADALRGLAALAVCWFHFTHGNPAFLPDGILKGSGNLGWVGVEVFFVISGYAMMVATRKTSFNVEGYSQFMGKRLLRLHPPYVVTVLMILILNWLSAKAPGFQGPPYDFHFPQFLSHLAYAVPFFHQDWYNPVFWTLCIEVQWYLVVGLLARPLHSPTRSVRWLVFALLLATAFVPSPEHLLFRYVPLFCLGLAAFYRRSKLTSVTHYVAALILCSTVSAITLNLTIAVAAFVTSLALTFVTIQNRVLLWFGGISYSLYLLHVPVGGRIINLALRLPKRLDFELAALTLAMTLSIFAAYLLWKFVEAPAHRMAQAYSHKSKRAVT